MNDRPFHLSIDIISSDFEGNAQFGEGKKRVSKTRKEKQRQGLLSGQAQS